MNTFEALLPISVTILLAILLVLSLAFNVYTVVGGDVYGSSSGDDALPANDCVRNPQGEIFE